MADKRPSLDASISSFLLPKSSIPDSETLLTTPKVQSRNNSHSLSSASSATSSTSRKSRHADVVPTDTTAGANISMPPPSSRPDTRTRTSSTYSSRTPSAADILRQGLSSSRRASKDDIAVEDFDTPRLSSTMADDTRTPDVNGVNRSRPSMSEGEGKRMSVSSMYSMNSARGVGGPVSAPSSANGSETGTKPRTASGALSPTKAFSISQPDTLTSVVSVTTSSSSNNGQGPNGLQLTPRETASSSDAVKLAAAQPELASVATAVSAKEDLVARPPIPARDRSRAKRRFSNSTGQSSHSPSSERGVLPAEKKPAPWGVIGVCALDVKARSKPSRNILSRIMAKQEFDLNVFGDKVILDEDVENWPVCDFLISFYSDGFPLDKAIAYVKLRKPFCVNDLPMQKVIWDRRSVLWILDKINVPTPTRLEVSRDGGPNITNPELAAYVQQTAGVELGSWSKIEAPKVVELSEDGDSLIVDGQTLAKPFVEKPVSGEDHNICVYYPKSQGGGARKLFRKIGNKSSEWVEDMNTPRAILEPENSYVYEKFMKVENAEDVKAYTVGTGFCHAETRKSPVVDGLVRRNNHGKEIRYITSLSSEEKAMASRIASTFGQRVCGFDLLRTYDGKSFVIDVNGWSFVKDNDEYYDQCARIMKEMFIHEKQRQLAPTSTILSPIVPEPSTPLGKSLPREEPQPHRSALQSLLSKSPSLSKLHAVHQAHKDNHKASPPGSVAPTPRDSPTGSNKGVQLPEIPHAPMLPPPILPTVPASAPATVPSTPSTNSVKVSEVIEHPVPPPAPKHSWKLKGMVSVIRHADRTPKQKYKFTFHTAPFIELLKGHQEEVLLTGEAALDSVMIAVEQAAKEGVEDRDKLRTLRNVLVKKGGWAGTKVQIKPMFRKRKGEEKAPSGADSSGEKTATSKPSGTKTKETPDPVGRTQRQDSVSDTTLSRITAIEESLVLDKLQLIVKWGGEPTHSARYQAQELGENMRNDLLLMNRELLDEVHVFSSSERRVTTSAQIWASAFTDRKELPSDFITVRKDLLDDSNAAKDEMDKVKKKLKTLLRQGVEAPPQFAWPTNMPEPSIVQRYVVQLMKFHRRVMRHNYGELYGSASSSLTAIANPGEKEKSGSLAQATRLNDAQKRWCCGEDAELFRERWEKLFSEFCDSEKVDPSKISELYDTMKFDALHNRPFLEFIFTPSQHILDEEEQAIEEESKGIEKEKKQPAQNSDSESQAQMEKSESSKSLHRRMFRRRSVMNASRLAEDTPEPHFRLTTGNSQTKAKTDAKLGKLRELYKLAKVLFDFICPQEYGIADHEKLEIGLLTSLPLVKEIVQDLEEMQSSTDSKSFVYFTKESHIYTLLNCILEGGIETKIKRAAIPELDYLSQICFELYESEDKSVPLELNGGLPTNNYSIRITISPGCHLLDPLDIQLDSKHCISCAPRRSLTSHGDWKAVIETLRAKFHQVKLPKSFLAVNLSENHTFHKKDDGANDDQSEQLTTAAQMTGEPEPMNDTRDNLLSLQEKDNGGSAIDAQLPSTGIEEVNRPLAIDEDATKSSSN